MSTFYHIDSTWRDRSQYPNPAQFEVPVLVAKGWRTQDRTVQAVRPHDKCQASSMVHTVKLKNMTIPYTGEDAGITFTEYPFLYVKLESTEFCDNKLINTLENSSINNRALDISGLNPTKVTLKDAVFVAYCDKIQNDGDLVPKWIQYKSDMIQTYRFDTNGSLSFRVFGNDGRTITIVDSNLDVLPNPDRQVNALFEVTPYVRDEAYDNHFVTLYDSNA